MLFQIYGEGAGWQLLGWVMVFAGCVFYCNLYRSGNEGGLGVGESNLYTYE